jgi:hypothetical protein
MRREARGERQEKSGKRKKIYDLSYTMGQYKKI